MFSNASGAVSTGSTHGDVTTPKVSTGSTHGDVTTPKVIRGWDDTEQGGSRSSFTESSKAVTAGLRWQPGRSPRTTWRWHRQRTVKSCISKSGASACMYDR
eukprot:1191051-Prorocentrum_minimum.AAC.2